MLRRLDLARRRLLTRLRRIERKRPERLGVIHADLHFGNLLRTRDGMSAIDFDDCGRGFYAHDLAVPLGSSQWMRSSLASCAGHAGWPYSAG
jgi:Ser/Thr protein kinase RdoA (MazF antagonist)